MAFEFEKARARDLLRGIEDGTMNAAQSFGLVDDADEVLVHLIFTWLRAKYRGDHPAAEGVIGRLATLCSSYPAATRKAKAGESDPVVEWFEDSYSYRKLDADEFIDVVVDKLES